MRPVGGKSDYQTNCRLIAATNRNPEEAIKDGKLREDLYYRISAISVNLPRCASAGMTSSRWPRRSETLRGSGQPLDQGIHPICGGSPHRL